MDMVRVRPARSDEAEMLADIGLRAWMRGIEPLVPPEVAERIKAGNPFKLFIRSMGGRLMVAEIDGVAAGLGARERDDDTISDIWVAPEREGRSAGSALLAELEKQIARAGYDTARLEVAAENARALKLYLARGYEPVWRETRTDPILQLPLEKIGMAKRLPTPSRQVLQDGRENT